MTQPRFRIVCSEPKLDVLVWFPRRDRTIPIVNLTCGICKTTAPAGAPDVDIVRVMGDSANGYETYHSACLGG